MINFVYYSKKIKKEWEEYPYPHLHPAADGGTSFISL